jgi:hypothetical protein
MIAREWYPNASPEGYRARADVLGDGPKNDGTTYLDERIPGSTVLSQAPLADFGATGISNVLTSALSPYLEKMNLLRGIDMLPATGHSSSGFLGNYAGVSAFPDVTALSQVPTIDQVLAYSPRFYPTAPALRSLEVGTGWPDGCSWTDYGVPGGAIEQRSCHLNPRDAWDQVFGGFMSPDAPVEDPNRSLMNAIHEDYARLRDSARIGVADRALLERHMSFLADIERAIGASSGVACTVPTRPRDLPNGAPWDAVSGTIEDFRDAISLLIDVAVAAIRCDITRIVTFSMQEALTDASGTWTNSLHNSGDIAGDWHQFAHDASGDETARRNLVAINRWIASEVFGAFVARLDVEEGGGKTFLDNALVVWGNEIGYNHYNTDLPIVTAGSAGGALRTGYFYDYIDWSADYANPIDGWGVLIPGLPHNRFLVTLLQAMGLRPEDYERDGQPGYGHTDIVGNAPYNWPADYDMGQIGSPLPGWFV